MEVHAVAEERSSLLPEDRRRGQRLQVGVSKPPLRGGPMHADDGRGHLRGFSKPQGKMVTEGPEESLHPRCLRLPLGRLTDLDIFELNAPTG